MINKNELNMLFEEDIDREGFSENTEPIFSAKDLHSEKAIVFDIHDYSYDRSIYECRVKCFLPYHQNTTEMWFTPNSHPGRFPYTFYMSKKLFYKLYNSFTIIYFPPNCKITKRGLVHIRKNQTLKQKIKSFFFPNISYR